MPRSFDVSFASPASLERVHGAFGNRRYWLDRLETLRGDKTLDSLEVDDAGVVRVVVTEDLRHGALPGLLAKVYRGDLDIETTEIWRPAGPDRVDGEIIVAVRGAPGSGFGTAALTRDGTGSQMVVDGTVEFKVPLVGGKIESFLAREFAKGIPEIQVFTNAWLAEND